MDGGAGGCAGAAIVAGDEYHLGPRFGHPGGDGAHPRLAHQLHRDAGLAVGALQVIDQLGQVLDGIDIVVGRGRDEGDAGGGVAAAGNPGVDLPGGQMAALPGLGPLGHFDLDFLGAHQIGTGDPEAAGGHLLDGGAPRRVLEPVRLLAPLAGVGFAPQQVHGLGQALVGLPGDGAIAHGPGFKAFDDGFLALHLLQGEGLLSVVHLQQAPEGVGFCLIVHQGGVLFKQLIVPPAGGLLQQMDGLGVVQVVLAAGAGPMLPQAVQGQVGLLPQGVKSTIVIALHRGGHLLQADAPHPGDGVGEVPVDHLLPDAHRLKDLGGLVGLEGGDPHFRGDLHHPMEDGGVVVGHSGVEFLVQQPLLNQVHNGLLCQVGVYRPGAVAQQGGKVVDLPGFGGFQQDGDGGALSGADQVLLHGGHRQ